MPYGFSPIPILFRYLCLYMKMIAIVSIKNLYKMSEIFTIGQIRSFRERLEGYHASGIIDFLHFRCFQRNYNMRAIVKISPILYKFLIQTIAVLQPKYRRIHFMLHIMKFQGIIRKKITMYMRGKSRIHPKI